jgi:hypothetical protein
MYLFNKIARNQSINKEMTNSMECHYTLDIILSKFNPVHTLTYYLKKYFNGILPSNPRSSEWCLTFKFYI